MSHSFLSRLPLSRFDIDRDHLAREREDLWEALWADPATRILPIFQGAALLSGPHRLALMPVDALPPADTVTRVYLGRTTSSSDDVPTGTPIVAVELEDARHLAEAEWANLRQVGAQLSDRDAGLLDALHRPGETVLVEAPIQYIRPGGDHLFGNRFGPACARANAVRDLVGVAAATADRNVIHLVTEFDQCARDDVTLDFAATQHVCRVLIDNGNAQGVHRLSAKSWTSLR